MFRGIHGVKSSISLGRRLYHSVDHPTSNLIINPANIESKILANAINYIPQYGIDKRCITQAIRDMNYSDSLQSVLTSKPGSLEYQLSEFWLKFQRDKLNQYILNGGSQFHSIKDEYDRIEHLINKRLEYNIPIKDKLSQLLSQLIIPYNIPNSMQELHNLSDDISYFAGDLSNDFAWYSKRITISSVYVSSELFQLQDSSHDFKFTKQFVKEKVNEMKKVGDAYTSVEEWGLFNAISLVNLIKSQILRG